jgi:hypothetical protein
VEPNIDIQSNDTGSPECETDDDHELDRGSIDIIAMDRDSVHFVVSCCRCGAQVSVYADNPKIEWGEPDSDDDDEEEDEEDE